MDDNSGWGADFLPPDLATSGTATLPSDDFGGWGENYLPPELAGDSSGASVDSDHGGWGSDFLPPDFVVSAPHETPASLSLPDGSAFVARDGDRVPTAGDLPLGEHPESLTTPPTSQPWELAEDATDLETITLVRLKELYTGEPRNTGMVEFFKSQYEAATDPAEKKRLKTEWQVEERRNRIQREMLAANRKDMEVRGITPEQLLNEERNAVEQDPVSRLINAPIMRGAITGVSGAASKLGESALRILPGEGAPSRMADRLGRQRAAEASYQSLLDNQQGGVASVANSATQVVGEFAPVSAAGGAAGLGTKGASLLSALFSGSGAANDAYVAPGATDAYAMSSAVINGLLTYAGGRVGGGTWEELFGGRIGARTAAKVLKSYGSELGEEFAQTYAQVAINRCYGVGNQKLPTWRENLNTLAVATIAQGAGEVIAGRAGADSKSAAAMDFVAKARPSRKDAEAAGVADVARTSQQRANLSDQTLAAVAQKIATESVVPNPQGTEKTAVDAEIVYELLPHTEPPPQQSAYTDADEEILGVLTKRLKRQLRSAGFRPDEMGVTVERFQDYFRARGFERFHPGIRTEGVTTNESPSGEATAEVVDEGAPTPEPEPVTRPEPAPPMDMPRETMQAATGIPIDKATASWFKRTFTSGGEQNEPTRKLVFKRDSIIRKHNAAIQQSTRDLMKAAKKANGVRPYQKLPDSISEQLNEALQDPAVAAQLPTDVAVEIQKIRDHIDGLSDQIQALGDTGQDLFMTIENNKGVYVTRSYKKFDDPEGWRKKAMADPQIMGDFAAEVRQSSPQATDEEIRTLAETLLRRNVMSNADFNPKESATQSYVNVLKKRKDLSAAVRALCGENKDVFVNYANTVGQMANLVANKGFVENLRAEGLAQGFFSEAGNQQPTHVQEVAHGQHRQLEGLQGILMEPELASAINDLYALDGVGWGWKSLATASSAVKAGKTVGAFPRAFIRNFFGNFPITLANGNWFQLNSMANFGNAAKATFLDDMLNRASPSGKAALQRMKELGVVESFSLEQLRDAAQHMATSARTFIEGVSDQNPIKRSFGGLANFYQAMDSVAKIHNYQAELETLQEAYPNSPLHELEEQAARITRAINPTYSEASKAAKWWARYAPVGSFAMFSAEILRTTGNRGRLIAEELRSGNPVRVRQGVKRLVGQGVAIAGLTAAAQALSHLLGTELTDEQEEAMRQRLAPWQRNSAILVTSVDEEGNPTNYVDLGYNDPFGIFTKAISALARGNPDEAQSQLTEPFFSEDILAGTLVSAVRGTDERGRPVWDEGQSEEEQNRQLMRFVMKKLEPGIVSSMKRAYEAYHGGTTSSGQELDLANEVTSNLGGLRKETFDRDVSDYYRNREFESSVKSSQSAIRRMFFNKGTFDPEAVRSQYLDAESTRRKTLQDWRTYVDGSIALGEKNPYAKVVSDVGANSDVVKMMYSKTYQPYAFRKEDLQKMLRLPGGQERVDLWLELREQASEFAD